MTVIAVTLLAITACGGGGATPTGVGTGGGGTDYIPQPSEYTVGGTVSGLVGEGLELVIINPANTAHHDVVLRTIDIGNNGPYRTGRAQDGYGVRIGQQPHSPTQQCVVRNDLGSYLLGPMEPAVNNVDVVCGETTYAADAASGTVSTFSVDAATGALAQVGSTVADGLSPNPMAMTPDKKFLYVGNRGSNRISVLSVAPNDGSLSSVSGSPFSDGGTTQALSIFTAYLRGYGPPLIKSYLYSANSGANGLSAFQIDRTTGMLAPLSPAAYAAGDSPSAMALFPDGPFLYVANTGGSTHLSAYLIDVYSGGLTPIVDSPYASDNSLSSLALGIDGKFLYASGASGKAAAVYAFSVNPNSGALSAAPGFPFPLPSCDFIRIDQSGSRLYATAGTNLLGYSIDPQTGTLDLLAGFPIAIGTNPHSISIDPTNQFLYVRSGSNGAVTGFLLDAATGALALMPGSPFMVGNSADFIATF